MGAPTLPQGDALRSHTEQHMGAWGSMQSWGDPGGPRNGRIIAHRTIPQSSLETKWNTKLTLSALGLSKESPF